jgi:ABC-type nitrate/sulfonate/bicarbonate transport system permease component
MNFNLDVAGIFAALLLLGIMGIALNFLSQFLRRKVVFWKQDSSSTQI